MNRAEFVKALKQAKSVLGAVAVNRDYMRYMVLTKADLEMMLRNHPELDEFDAVLDSDGTLRIN